MDKFDKVTSVAAPLPLINVDTDMIIPSRFLKTIKRTGLGADLFSTLRFNEDGSDREEFVLNKPAYKDAEILIAGENFGCGSSRCGMHPGGGCRVPLLDSRRRRPPSLASAIVGCEGRASDLRLFVPAFGAGAV